jgi:tetratricopeptide (TPR) repeat protein
MILLDYWPLRRFESPSGKVNPVLWQLKEKLPFLALSVIFSIITIYGQYDASQKKFLLDYRLANASVSFVTYLGKTFWPHDLAVFYPFLKQIPLGHVSGAIILIIIITAFVIVTAKRLPYLFVGWLWYAITILPVIGIIQSGYQAMADRYHYLPSIGIAVGLAWGVPLLFQSENMRKKILFPAGIAALCALLILTFKQCGYWRNSIELFSHTLRITHDNALAHNQLGLVFFEKNKDREALYHYNKSIIIQPLQDSAYNNRGAVYLKQGEYRQALDDFNKAIAINPSYIRAYNNRANIYVQSGHYDLAIKDLSEAVRLSPNYINAYYNRGFILAKIGLYQNAVKDFDRVIILNPNYADAYNNRAIVYLNMGNTQSGCNDAKKACGLGNCATLQTFTGKGLCR